MNPRLIPILVLLLVSGTAAGEPPAPQWKHEVGVQIWSQPAHDGEFIYFGADDGALRKADIPTGTASVIFQSGARIRSGVTVAGDLLLFASDDGHLYALDRGTGQERWRFDLGSGGLDRRLPAVAAPYTYDYAHSSPVVHAGRVFIGSADHNVYAVDLETGGQLWKFTTGGMVRGTPLVVDDALFVGSWDGLFYAIGLESGNRLWAFEAGGPVTGGAAASDGRVVFGSRSAKVFALHAASGEPAWEYVHADGSWVESSPVIRDGTVYIGSSDALKLYALDLETGTEQWAFRTGGWSWGAPLVTATGVCIGAISAHPYYMPGVVLQRGLFMVDRGTGELLWSARTDSPVIDGFVTGGVFAAPIVVGDHLLVAGIDGVITAISR